MVTSGRTCRAFTLVELLVAVGISAVIVVMLGTMFASLTGTATRANQRMDAFREARAALQIIERDLTGLVHTPSSAYFLVTNQTYSDPASTKSTQIYALCAIKNKPLIGSASATPAPGDVCAIGYYCGWDTNNHYSLHRYFRDSAATFAFFQKAGAGNYVSPITLYSPGSGDELLATYVWNLQVTPYKADGTIDTTPIPIEVGSPGVTLPAAVEISFTAMSTSAAKTMMSVSSSPNDWMDTTSINYKRLIAPHAYQFRTRINLP